MAHIKKVRFEHVGKNDGCMCDNCGQWITNIVTIKFQEGEELRFGVDCYNNQICGKLNKFGQKEMKRILKSIQGHSRLLDDLKSGKDTELVTKEWNSYRTWQTYWSDKSIDEWKHWMITEVLPKWIEKDDSEMAKFSKINF